MYAIVISIRDVFVEVIPQKVRSKLKSRKRDITASSVIPDL